MGRWIGLVCLGAVLAVVAWGNWSGTRATSAQAAVPAAKYHFLQIGKTYQFSTGGLGLIVGRILDGPTGDWVKLEVVGDRKGVVWVNLNLIASIEQTKSAD